MAQKVLQGNTKGCRNHPQLLRCKQQQDPIAAIAAYLQQVQREKVLQTHPLFKRIKGKVEEWELVPAND